VGFYPPMRTTFTSLAGARGLTFFSSDEECTFHALFFFLQYVEPKISRCRSGVRHAAPPSLKTVVDPS